MSGALPFQHVIFQHTPKCGGSSVRNALRKAFGQENYTWERPDGPPLTALTTRVHAGHFKMARYRHIRNAFRFAIIRDPIQRTISHYCFWKSSRGEKFGARRRKILVEQNLTIEQFAEQRKFRHYYSQHYFEDVADADFNLIIDTDDFSGGLNRLSRALGRDLETRRDNASAGIDAQTAALKAQLAADDTVRSNLQDILRDDIRTYEEITRWHCYHGTRSGSEASAASAGRCG